MNKSLYEYVAQAKINRKKSKKVQYQIIKSNITYPAFIKNAEYREETDEMVIQFVVFNSLAGRECEAKFRMNNASSHYYDEICDIIGSEGQPESLIGKTVYLHYENNNGFQNVKVESLITLEELNQYLEDLEQTLEEYEKPKKRIKKKKKICQEEDSEKSDEESGDDL